MTPKDTIYNGADEKTRAFSAKLIPTKKAIIGLKTPFVESVAKDIAAGEIRRCTHRRRFAFR